MAQKTVRTLTAYKCRVCELYHDENLLDLTGEREIVVDIYCINCRSSIITRNSIFKQRNCWSNRILDS